MTTRLGITKKGLRIGGLVLVGYVLVYYVACLLLRDYSLPLRLVSDVGFVALELAVLALCTLAWRTSGEHRGRVVWTLVIVWVFLNVVTDVGWAYYDLSGRELPTPSVSHVTYLLGYIAGFAAVFVAAWKTTGGLRTVETVLDSLMLSMGAAALSWPVLVGPLLQLDGSTAEYWVNLAGPVGGFLVLFAFISFFLSAGDTGRKPRPFYVVLTVAFLIQIFGDSAYLMLTVVGGEYGPGTWMDPLWLLAFAMAGVAALLELRFSARWEEPSANPVPGAEIRRAGAVGLTRMLIPYLGLPIIGLVVVVTMRADGWQWTVETRALAYMGFALVGLLFVRQYITLARNRRLNVDLTQTSAQLEEKLGDLADLNESLELLNAQSRQLNSLHEVRAVAEAGLELACDFAKSPGGWVTLRDDEGWESVTVIRGPVVLHRPGDAKFNAVEVANGVLRALPLQTRGEELGTVWLVRPEKDGHGPDLLPVIAAHISTAIDNTRRYEEAVHLAERDPLTGLFNHRGIHKRLAGESLRAQQNGTELSLIMLDMDDFKLLNDTYGHPAGDKVLRHVSDAIRGVLRHADLAGRVGGDELLIVLPNTGSDGAVQLSERLRERLNGSPYVLESGQQIQVRVSLGVATFPSDAQSLGQLLETADANLYASKQQGGNTVTGASPADDGRVDAQGILGVAGKLLDVVGARDHYTRKHSEHVVVYALSLGEALGLPEESLNTLHMAALLHDVGKIGVSADLLRRPTALSPGEHDLVRRHVDLGAALINDMPRLARVAEAVNSHHEHHDGTGYPSEAEGDDIPLLGRILAVADAYSAMTLDRPYRKGMSRERARAELLKVSGTQLDPALVDEFVRLIDMRTAQSGDDCAEAG